MYLLKQWREGRVVLLLAALGLALELAGAAKIVVDAHSGHRVGSDVGGFFALMCTLESLLIGWWAWMAGGVGMGRNLGENSGSYLLTRPRRRAWFVWRDWAAAAVLVVVVAAIANAILAMFCTRLMTLAGLQPGRVPLYDGSTLISLTQWMTLQTFAVLAFAGLLYGLSYLSTVVMKRQAGMGLSVGIVVVYLIGRGLLHHLYRMELPGLMPTIVEGHRNGIGMQMASGLEVSLAVRMGLVVLFPVAAQLVLDRAEV